MSSVIVRGAARQLVQPDRVIVALRLTAVAKTAAGALDEVSARSVTLSEGISRLGFDTADWVTDGITVAEEWEYRRDTNTLIGHRASTVITVTVDQVERLAPLVGLAVGDASAQVRDLTWEVDGDHPVRRELLGRAARDARGRAEAYASALDLELGAVELISEMPIQTGSANVQDGMVAAMSPMMRSMKGGAQATDMAVSGGQIELAAEIHVRFSILPKAG